MSLRFVFGGGDGIIYAVRNSGELLFYRDEARDGTRQWAFNGEGKQIGQEWDAFRHVFSGGGGIIYAINGVGELFFYKDEVRNGNGVWAPTSGQRIGQGWGEMRHVISGDDGVIYAIDSAGDIFFYRDEARNGNGVWAFGGVGQKIGQGWTSVIRVFSGGGGIIYAVTSDGDLLFYRDQARDGNGAWANGGVGQKIGTDWGNFRNIFSGDDGIIYAVNLNNELMYFKDQARDGSSDWAFGGTGQRIGTGWDAMTPDYQVATKWGFCITAFTGQARLTTISPAWVNAAFSGSDGVASYFTRMSGGRRQIGWQVFGPVNLMPIGQKKQLDGQGAGPTIAGFRTAAPGAGISLNGIDHMMWMIDDGISTGGTTPSDSLIGAIDFKPQNVEHEITHSCGVCCHADQQTYDDYGDLFCIMGSQNAKSFLDVQLISEAGHCNAGPGTCTPYLFVAGWLDTVANAVVVDPGTTSGSFTLDANQGAPTWGDEEKVALVVGDRFPQQIGDAAQFWIEYRHPSNFDRGFEESGVLGPPRPTPGLVLLHRVECLAGRCNGAVHSLLNGVVVAAAGNSLVVNQNTTLKVTSVDTAKKQLSFDLTPA